MADESVNEKLMRLLRKLYGIAEDSAAMYASAPPSSPEVANVAMGLTPGIGEAMSAYDAYDAAKNNQWAMAGLGALGALPMVGMMARGVRAGQSVPRAFGQAGQIVSMNPDEFLRLAMPFNRLGGGPPKKDSLDYIRKSGNLDGAYLTVVENPEDMGRLRVGMHDGRHRALVAKERGLLFNVDIRKGQRMKREMPDLTEEELIKLIEDRGGLLPEID